MVEKKCKKSVKRNGRGNAGERPRIGKGRLESRVKLLRDRVSASARREVGGHRSRREADPTPRIICKGELMGENGVCDEGCRKGYVVTLSSSAVEEEGAAQMHPEAMAPQTPLNAA